MLLSLIWTLFLSSIAVSFVVGPLLGKSGFGLAPYVNLLYTGGVAFFVALHFTRFKAISSAQGQHLWYSGIIFTLGLMAAIGFIYGFAMQWPEIYILGDTIYAVIAILVYMAAKFLSIHSITENQWGAFTRHLSWIAAITIVLLITDQSGVSLRFKFLFMTASLLILMADPPKRINAAIMISPLLLTIADTNRTIFVVFVVLICCLFFVYRVRTRVVLGTMIVISVVGGMLYGTNISGTKLGARISEMTSLASAGGNVSKRQITLYQRIFEAQIVWSETQSASTFEIVFGHGAGAVLDMNRTPDESVTGSALLGGGKVHAIHILPVAIFYRHGLVGLIWLCLISGVVLLTLWNLRNSSGRRMDRLYVFSAMYPLLSITNGMAASTHFITDFLVYACLGYIAGREVLIYRAQRSRLQSFGLATA